MATTARSDAGSVAVASGADGDAARLSEAVLQRLREDGFRFDFFQAVRLLERIFTDAPPPGETTDARREVVHLRPDTAVAFPATDVRRVETGGDREAEVTVTFMGLYGIGSPLPEFFYEVLSTGGEEVAALRDFLDIFNQRIYTAFYRAWKKYRPELRRLPDYSDRDSKRFLAFGGIGTPAALDDAPVPRALLMAFAGRLLPQRRNAEGLEALVSAWLNLPVEVVQNVPRWVPIRDPKTLGQEGGLALGRTSTIGRSLHDCMGKFRLCIGPMGRDRYLELLPQGAKAGPLQWLVQTYLTDYLDFDVELHLRTGDLPPARLGDTSCRLGWSTCLGTPRDEVLKNVVQYDTA